MRYGPDRTQVRLGILDHGSEFEYGEPAAVETYTNLPIQNRPSICNKSNDCDDCQQRREQDQRCSGQNDVNYAFGKTVWANDRSMPAEARSSE
jgi:hypothetical protein